MSFICCIIEFSLEEKVFVIESISSVVNIDFDINSLIKVLISTAIWVGQLSGGGTVYLGRFGVGCGLLMCKVSLSSE